LSAALGVDVVAMGVTSGMGQLQELLLAVAAGLLLDSVLTV
jgi:hypothetical protein